MKIITLILLFISLTTYQKGLKEIKLGGNYKMEFETEFADQNCLIKITDKKFVRSLNTGHKIKGKVELIKLKFGQLYRLKSNKSNIEIDVEGSTYHPSDTIFFRTKRVGEKDSDDALTIYSGKLIKLK